MPPAARLTDLHVCPASGGPIIPPCEPTVLIGGLPAARLGDFAVDAETPDVIVQGSMSVLIGGRPAARIGDKTAAGGGIVTGCPTVLIGDLAMGGPAFCLKCAAKQAAAFLSGI